MFALDAFVPLPVREEDKPFLMSVEDVFSIEGRGTVATGRVERGTAKVGDEVEIIGLRKDKTETTSPASRCSTRRSTRRSPATTSGPSCGVSTGRDRTRPGHRQAGQHHPAYQVRGQHLRTFEGRRRPAHPVLQQVQAAILLPDDRRDRLIALPTE